MESKKSTCTSIAVCSLCHGFVRLDGTVQKSANMFITCYTLGVSVAGGGECESLKQFNWKI